MKLNQAIAAFTLLGMILSCVGVVPLTANAEEITEPKNASARVIDLWPQDPPTWPGTNQTEEDTTKEDGQLIDGNRVIRLGNVSKPQLHLYPARNDSNPSNQENASTMILVCPGGGYSILAWDLEGTEIAERFNQLGFSAGVVKYRCPTRQASQPWLAPVQDIQRAISMVRAMSDKITEKELRVGLVGFSAGGNAAGRVAAAAGKRFYEMIDQTDHQSCEVDFAGLIYPSFQVDSADSDGIIPELNIKPSTPPMFFAHAIDDRVSCHNSIRLFSALQANQVPAELHVFASGGHGFGARASTLPAASWPEQMSRWIDAIKPDPSRE